jgi:serine phosphatase RsbU (regulator of sigma subunit)
MSVATDAAGAATESGRAARNAAAPAPEASGSFAANRFPWPVPALPILPARPALPVFPFPLSPPEGMPSASTSPAALPAGGPSLTDLAELARLSVPDLGPVNEVLGHLDDMQGEVDALRTELNLLRRRDETLNFYIHRLDEELRLAARLQQDFLPKTLPEAGPIRFHTLFRPAGYVSGDLYNVCRVDGGRIGFYVADAVGHGMPAALLTMFIKHALVTLLDPGEALARLNTTLVHQELTQATFATALYGVLEPETLRMSLAKAGHPSPLLLRADGSHEWLDVTGPLLGIFPDEAFPTRTVQLRPGDRVVLYTDGIEVAFVDPQKPDEPRWQDELLCRRHLPPERLLQEFADEMDQEPGSLDPRDDLTMMVIEVREG